MSAHTNSSPLSDAVNQRLDYLQDRAARAESVCDAALSNIQDGWQAMRLLREVVETLGPVGAVRSSEHIACAIAPTFEAKGAELTRGIQAIANERDALRAERDRLRAALERVAEEDVSHFSGRIGSAGILGIGAQIARAALAIPSEGGAA